MRKIFLALVSVFVIINSLHAQDLIVTNSGDSINCKITKTTQDYIHFTFMYNGEIRNTLLPTDQIITLQKDWFSESELPANYTHTDIFPHFRLAIDGGGQYRTAKLADMEDANLRKHFGKMKLGYHYDIQAAYFYSESQGIELMFSKQLFEHTLGYGSLSDANGNLIGTGVFKEKIAFDYIGVNYICRLFDSRKKNCWLLSLGLGYMGDNDKFIFDNVENAKITAFTFASHLTIGYDIGLSENFAIGFKLALMGGSYKNYKWTNHGITTNITLPDNTSEGLSTIKLSVGLRFNK